MNGSADLGDIVNKLTENPEMMKTLMGVANNLFSSDNGVREKEGERREYYEHREHRDNNNECRDSERFNAEQRRGGAQCDNECEKHDNRRRKNDAEDLIRLLIALKPYVSDDRCSKIDSVIKILKLIQLSEKTGLLKNLL